MPIQVTGVDRTLRGMKSESNKIGMKIATGLDKAADMVLKRSQKYVPEATGALKKSGRKETGGVGLGAWARVTYGGPGPRTHSGLSPSADVC
jgi:hypothetical protein